ncbi:MAG: tyrosine-protein phosphatase [Enterococcus sp.]
MAYVRLPLENTYNTRELGGYRAANGQTKWHTFLRSDDLKDLNQADLEKLQQYGVNQIIDLRSEAELERSPHPVASPFEYIHIPLAPGDVKDVTKIDYATFTLGSFYQQLIVDAQGAIKQVFDRLVQQEGVLFHCAAGKDRTGVIAALILGSVGVSKGDIIANYQTTATYLAQSPLFTQQGQRIPEHLAHLSRSDAQTMAELLDFIDEKYQDIPTYLEKIGVSKVQQQQLQALFVEV